MKKVTLKLVDILELEAELNGLVDRQTGKATVEGILSKELDLVLKYWLSQLAKKLTKEREAVDALREELIKKYGKEENGAVSIPLYVNEVHDEEGKIVSADVNPDYVKFQEEYSKLLQEEKEIEHKELSLDNFEGIKSKDFPRVLFTLITPPDSE